MKKPLAIGVDHDLGLKIIDERNFMCIFCRPDGLQIVDLKVQSTHVGDVVCLLDAMTTAPVHGSLWSVSLSAILKPTTNFQCTQILPGQPPWHPRTLPQVVARGLRTEERL